MYSHAPMLIRWHIRGNRFLHKQVRSMVGLLFDVGRGRYELGVVDKIFKGEFKGERTWAPPHGLILESVGYT
jgi:tRNA pseudouridine38-40 synthase